MFFSDCYSRGFHGVVLFFAVGRLKMGWEEGWCGEHGYGTVRVSRRMNVRLGSPRVELRRRWGVQCFKIQVLGR